MSASRFNVQIQPAPIDFKGDTPDVWKYLYLHLAALTNRKYDKYKLQAALESAINILYVVQTQGQLKDRQAYDGLCDVHAYFTWQLTSGNLEQINEDLDTIRQKLGLTGPAEAQ